MGCLNLSQGVIAHRGASAYAPENTLAAFTKAAQLGIKWLEFDVELTAANEAVIIHDETLDRTTNGQGLVVAYPYAYLQTLDAGAWFNPIFSGERIPSLKQAIEFVYQNHLSANVEIKPQPGCDAKLVDVVVKQMRELPASATSTILYSSFSIEALYRLRAAEPDVLIGLLLHEWEPDWQLHCEKLNCISVHVNEKILTRETAQTIKRMGKALCTYTVNEPKRAELLLSWGVDAFFSDYPDRIAATIDRIVQP